MNLAPAAKRRRLNFSDNNDGLMPLNDHCFFHVFEYFEINELCTLGRTCTKLKELVDTFFKQRFRNKLMTEEVIIQSKIGQGIFVGSADEYVSYFLKFMQNVRICESFVQRPLDFVEFMRKNCGDTFERIAFQQIKFQQVHGTLLVDWLTSVEGLAFFGCEKLYDVLKHCNNLKNLKVDQHSKDPPNRWADRWMDQQYPTIEHLQCGINPTEKLSKFLIRNPNVKVLTLNLDSVDPASIQRFMQQLHTINLEKLLISFDSLQDFRMVADQLKAICNRTGFIGMELCFNRRFSFRSLHMECLKDFTKLIGLHFLNREPSFSMVYMHVKVLQLQLFPSGDILKCFPNLEEVYVTDLCADFEALATPIVRNFRQLKKIVARSVKILNHDGMTWFRLEKHFNHERKMLRNACQLDIYINKDAYDGTPPVGMPTKLVRLMKADFQNSEVNFVDPFLVNFDF